MGNRLDNMNEYERDMIRSFDRNQRINNFEAVEAPELKKQFQVVLWNKGIIISTPSNNLDAFKVELNLPGGIEIKIGWHDSLETSAAALNYHECCGVLILFGIQPPTYVELCNHLKMKIT